MAYVNSTILNADPAAALITALETALTAHANYDQVESGLVISTSTHNVWRNNGSGPGANAFGSNYYFSIEKVSTTQVRFRPFEAYTISGGVAANARMIRPTRAPGNTPIVPNADGSYGLAAGYTLSDTSNCEYLHFLSLPTSGFEYFFIISNNYIRMGIRSGANDGVIELGLFESMLPASGTPETFPLYLTGSGSSSVVSGSWSPSSQGYVAASRHPNLPDTTSRANLWNLSYNTSDQGPTVGGPSSTDYDRHQGSGIILAGRPLLQQLGTPRSTYGYIRGRLRDFLTFATQPGTLRIGDDYTFNPSGTPDVYLAWLYTTGSRCWIKRDVT